MSAQSDAIITYAILRKFTTPITETQAFKLGLVDEKGYPTYKASHDFSEKNRDAYTLLDRLVFKLKRKFTSMPTFSKLVGGYAASLAYIKESTDVEDFSIFEHLDPYQGEYFGNVILGESFLNFEDHIIVTIAENSSLLSKLVTGYEKGIQDTVYEEVVAMADSGSGSVGNSVSSGQVQGLATEPVITPQAQKRWTSKTKGRKIEEILP